MSKVWIRVLGVSLKVNVLFAQALVIGGLVRGSLMIGRHAAIMHVATEKNLVEGREGG